MTPEQVAEIIREVAAETCLPYFQQLDHGQVSEKGPNDLLTVADIETEVTLGRRLSDHLPGSVVVGEEAVHDDPGILDRLAGDDPCWLIDPIDGTINFAHGLPLFAIMLALVRRGEVGAAWIYDPVHDHMAAAERGGGTWFDGAPVRLSPPPDLAHCIGCLHLPREDTALAAHMGRNRHRYGPELILHCAGIEYQTFLRDRLHFAVYHRTKPWDHAPGTLLLAEAGGHVAHIDGQAYGITAPDQQVPLLAAAGEGTWQAARDALFLVS